MMICPSNYKNFNRKLMNFTAPLYAKWISQLVQNGY